MVMKNARDTSKWNQLNQAKKFGINEILLGKEYSGNILPAIPAAKFISLLE